MASEGESSTNSCCANCGRGVADADADADENGVKLNTCSACRLVRYCSTKCQKEHWPKHKRSCKARAAELRDEILFKQPESSHLGDCPICCLPLPIGIGEEGKICITVCCNKYICLGCFCQNQARERTEMLEHKCPYCRQSKVLSKEDGLKQRAKMNDPLALYLLANSSHKDRDDRRGYEDLIKAAGFGSVDAQYDLGRMYFTGKHGTEMNHSKAVSMLEKAAISGHPNARDFLGLIERINCQHQRAVKHWIIAANLGLDQSVENLKSAYKEGLVSKDDLAAALRAHQAAVDAMKSPHRTETEEAQRNVSAEMKSWLQFL